MKFSLPNEGMEQNPTFISRRVGHDRASNNLEALAKGIVHFLEKPSPVSDYELSELFNLISKGQLEIQNKKKKIILEKIKRLRSMESAQRERARKMRK